MHGQLQRERPKTSPVMILGNGFREGNSRKRDRRDDNGCTRPSTKNKIHFWN